jgi:hypothetical protein
MHFWGQIFVLTDFASPLRCGLARACGIGKRYAGLAFDEEIEKKNRRPWIYICSAAAGFRFRRCGRAVDSSRCRTGIGALGRPAFLRGG